MFDLFGHLQCLGTPPQRIQSTRLTQLMVAILAVGTLSPLTAVTASVAPTLAYLRVLPVDQAALPSADTVLSQRFHQDHVLGTSLDVVLVGLSPVHADQVFKKMLDEIERLDRVLSIWRDDSEIAQLNQRSSFRASEDLFAVIAACEQWQTQTCGAFSARLGGLLQQWQSAQQITALRPDTDWQQVAAQLATARVDLNSNTRQIDRATAVQFSPDALAKGYVIDRVIAVALAEQSQHLGDSSSQLAGVLVDIGGDLRVWGQAPREAGWQVAVRSAGARADNLPVGDMLQLNNQAVALSGRGARDLRGTDEKTAHSHLFSPITGLPLDHVEQAVVVATTTADADALATALAAMSAAQGLALIESLVGVEAKVSMTDGQTWQSSGWQRLLSSPPAPQLQNVVGTAAATALNHTAATRWPSGFQANLTLELPKIASADYRAPYVVVWITDAQKNLVRSLQVWGNKPKWMDTNYVWWRRHGRKMEVDSIAQPSRKPGEYRLMWDGKNDAGQQLPAGEYTVHVEAAREHGDHSYQQLPLKVAPMASQQQVNADKELGRLILRFDRVI